MATLVSGLSNFAIETIVKYTDPETLALWRLDDPVFDNKISALGTRRDVSFFPSLPSSTVAGCGLSGGGGWSWKRPTKSGHRKERNHIKGPEWSF